MLRFKFFYKNSMFATQLTKTIELLKNLHILFFFRQLLCPSQRCQNVHQPPKGKSQHPKMEQWPLTDIVCWQWRFLLHNKVLE